MKFHATEAYFHYSSHIAIKTRGTRQVGLSLEWGISPIATLMQMKTVKRNRQKLSLIALEELIKILGCRIRI